MSDWIETYRGSVEPHETDTTEHLTVARYFARFADATLTLLQHCGLGIDYMRRNQLGYATVECQTRYLREFGVGDILHFNSAILEIEDKKIVAGHRIFDSASGEMTTTMIQNMIHIDLQKRSAVDLNMEKKSKICLTDWPNLPDVVLRPKPTTLSGFIDTYRDTVKPWQIDIMGHMSIQFYVERYSSAGLQLFSAMGLTPDWLRKNRRGFSTFDYQLKFFHEMNVGDLILIKTALVHLGSSSVRILHRLIDPTSGRLAAELDQFGVLLDLDKRKPTRIPAYIREKAEALLVHVSN